MGQTVIEQRALESICQLPGSFESLTKELKRANDLRERELICRGMINKAYQEENDD